MLIVRSFFFGGLVIACGAVYGGEDKTSLYKSPSTSSGRISTRVQNGLNIFGNKLDQQKIAQYALQPQQEITATQTKLQVTEISNSITQTQRVTTQTQTDQTDFQRGQIVPWSFGGQQKKQTDDLQNLEKQMTKLVNMYTILTIFQIKFHIESETVSHLSNELILLSKLYDNTLQKMITKNSSNLEQINQLILYTRTLEQAKQSLDAKYNKELERANKANSNANNYAHKVIPALKKCILRYQIIITALVSGLFFLVLNKYGFQLI